VLSGRTAYVNGVPAYTELEWYAQNWTFEQSLPRQTVSAGGNMT